MDILEDNMLMEQVKAGQIDKLSLLYKRYSRVLFGYFYHLTHDAASSEDMVQTVFYRLLKYRHTFKGEGKFTTWMYHMARNVRIDAFKKNRRMQYNESMEPWEKQMEHSASRETEITDEEQTMRVRKALEMLPEDKRELLVLSRYQGMKYQEIAEMVNSSEGAVKVKIHRALKDLKKAFVALESI